MHVQTIFRVLLRLDEMMNEHHNLTAQEHTRPLAFIFILTPSLRRTSNSKIADIARKRANGLTIRVELADTQSRVEHARFRPVKKKIEHDSVFGFCVGQVREE